MQTLADGIETTNAPPSGECAAAKILRAATDAHVAEWGAFANSRPDHADAISVGFAAGRESIIIDSLVHAVRLLTRDGDVRFEQNDLGRLAAIIRLTTLAVEARERGIRSGHAEWAQVMTSDASYTWIKRAMGVRFDVQLTALEVFNSSMLTERTFSYRARAVSKPGEYPKTITIETGTHPRPWHAAEELISRVLANPDLGPGTIPPTAEASNA